jgi:hypothetical protein
MKTKMYLLSAILAILFSANNSSWAQTQYAGTKTVTSAGNVDLSEWIIFSGPNQKYLLKIVVEKVDPQTVMTGVNSWTAPSRGFPNNYPDLLNFVNAQWAPNNLPGFYSIIGGNGDVLYDASYISDPWVGVDQVATTESPQLTSFNGTITAQSVVNLKLSDVFATGNYTRGLMKLVNGTETLVAYNQVEYQISETGSYFLRTKSGASSPTEDLHFDVVITGSTDTKTVKSAKEDVRISVQSGRLVIESSTPMQSASVYSISGQLLKQAAGKGTQIVLDDLPKNQLVIVEVVAENGSRVRKKVVM